MGKVNTLVLIVSLLVLPALYALTGGVFHDHDPFAYAGAVQESLDGGRIYGSIWQNKPPVALLAYLLPQIVVRGSYAALQFSLGCWMALLVAVWVVFEARTQRLAAYTCATFMALLPMSSDAFIWLSTENISAPLVMALLLLSLRIFRSRSFTAGQMLWAGVLLCLGFHVRQNAVLFGVVPVLAAASADVRGGRKLLGLVLMAAGGIVAWVPILLAMAAWGDLKGYFVTVFLYPSLYAAKGSSHDIVTLIHWAVVRPYGLLALLFVPWAFVCGRRTLVVAAVAAGLAATLAPLKPYPHYWMTFAPVLGLCIYMVLDDAVSVSRRARGVLASFLVVYVLLGVVSALSRCWDETRREEFRQYQAVARAVDELASDQDSLCVVGRFGPYLYFATRVPAAHTFWWDVLLDPYHDQTLPVSAESIVEDYLRDPPTLLLVHDAELAQVRAGNDSLRRWRLVAGLLGGFDYKEVRHMPMWSFYRLSAGRPGRAEKESE